MSSKKHYPESSAKPDFPKLEQAVLEIWDRERTFEQSVAGREGSAEFVFYDGPPFANGMPHYGHVLQSYNKDTVGRYKTMRGYHVARRWGWDCHGLPPELKTEKELGLMGKRAIRDYGVAKFVEKCRSDVLTYASDWKSIVRRMGRWVDIENAYKTMDTFYTESIMWAFKTLYDKGLIYEDFRTLPYSWAAETVLSNFEVNLNYKEKTDPAITVRFELENGLTLLAWTTTPWTLPSNMFLAVGPEIEYSVFDNGLVLATSRVEAYRRELGEAKLERIMLGRELAGLKYKPLFQYFADKNAFEVLCGDFVSDADGTGVVHIAPGFGEDDFNLVKAARSSFPLVRPVDGEGKFTAEVPDYAGMQVFEANEPIIERLRASGALFKKDQIVHQYPYCWRTDKPLIYMAMSSWFVKVVELKKVLLDDNQLVNWIPEHIKDGRFGKWLDGARDWSISRNRFWGAPIPVWRSEDGEQIVIGSIAELAALSGKEVSDLHRPYVDIEFMRGGKVFRRVEDVFDCWFESGAMPFASVHYPFENKEFFERNFPADFIAEATDQTRGWFYTMAVLGVALFGKIPYKTCGVTGFIFDEKGQKLSKKLGNYSEPNEFFDKFGSDAFRWLLLASPVLKGEIARISKDGAEVAKAARRSTIPLYNAYHFFTLYANADGVEATYDKSSGALLDRYILAKTAELADVATKAMDRYDVASFCYEVEKFLDTLNNWYIRLSRERFWGTGVERARQQEAFNTLYSVLVDLSRLVAPVLPFTSEHIYRALCGGESVHLADWPKAEAVDTKLVEDMEAARAICSLVHTIRDFKGIPNRQPLAKLEVFGQVPHELLSIIAAESNVRNVGMSPALALPKLKSELYLITPVLGKKYGRGLADIQKAAKAGEYALADGVCKIAGYELAPGEYELKFSTLDERYSVTPDGRVIIELDTTITPELEFEGLMRDFMRAVQEERKNMGLDVADRIRLYYSGVSVPSEWAEEIKKTTLAVEFIEGEGVVAVPDTTIKFKIERA